MNKSDIKLVVEYDNGEGYDWDIFQIGMDNSGVYYYRQGSGCSCNDISDDPWIRLEHGNLDECRKASENYIPTEDKIRFENILKGICKLI